MTDTTRYRCDICGRTFPDRHQARDHITAVHDVVNANMTELDPVMQR